jgi:hypothetical protein
MCFVVPVWITLSCDKEFNTELAPEDNITCCSQFHKRGSGVPMGHANGDPSVTLLFYIGPNSVLDLIPSPA